MVVVCRSGVEGAVFVGCLYQGRAPLDCLSREWACGRATVQSVVAFVCECLLLIGRGVPKYRVARLLNQLKDGSTSGQEDREEKPPPPVEVQYNYTLYMH